MEKILQNESFKNTAPKFKSDVKTDLKRFRTAVQKQTLEKGELSQHQVGYFSPLFIFLSLVFLSDNPEDGRREES